MGKGNKKGNKKGKRGDDTSEDEAGDVLDPLAGGGKKRAARDQAEEG